jgi:hypothetical protein
LRQPVHRPRWRDRVDKRSGDGQEVAVWREQFEEEVCGDGLIGFVGDDPISAQLGFAQCLPLPGGQPFGECVAPGLVGRMQLQRPGADDHLIQHDLVGGVWPFPQQYAACRIMLNREILTWSPRA